MEDAAENEFDTLSIFDNPWYDDVSPWSVEAATSQGQIGYSAERESLSSRIQAYSEQPGCSQHEPASRHDKVLETAFQPSALEGSDVTTSWSDYQQFLPADLHQYGSLHLEVLELAHKLKLQNPWMHDPDKPQNRTELCDNPVSWWQKVLTALRKASQGKRKSSPPIFKRGDDGHWCRTEIGRAYRISELRLKAGENLPRPPKDVERETQKTKHVTLPGRKRQAQSTGASQDLQRPIGSTLNQVHQAESRTQTHDIINSVVPDKSLVLRWKAMLDDERDDAISNFRCRCGRLVEHEGAGSQLFENATDYVRCRYKWDNKTGERLLVSAETDCKGEMQQYCGVCSLLLDTKLIRTCCGRHKIHTSFHLSSMGNGEVTGGRRRVEFLLRMFKRKEEHDGNPVDWTIMNNPNFRCHSCQLRLTIRDSWDHDIYPVQHYPRPFDCIVCFYDYNRFDGEKYLRFTKMHVEDDAIRTSIPGRFRCIACTKSLERQIRLQLPGAEFLGAACREKNINYCRCENTVCECGFRDEA